MGTWLVAGVTWLLISGPFALPAEAGGAPPISARFETPRDFAYHIGDLIPLTLVIEAAPGVVIDLDRLPHRGGTVDLFEVRDVRIDRARTASGRVYRVTFTLQTFVPGTLVPGVAFPPLELHFAQPEDRLGGGGDHDRSVTLPPYRFFLSPTTVGQDALRPNKGSTVPRVGWSFWGTVGVGVLCLGMAALELGGDLLRQWRQRRPTPERRALRALTVLEQRYAAGEDKAPVLFRKTSGVLRRFLREECGVPAPVQTVAQIRERFRGHPLQTELAEVLERCTHVTYDGHHPTSAEKAGILRAVAALIGRLEEVGCPVPGGNGAPR